jgi:hypothetical protein
MMISARTREEIDQQLDAAMEENGRWPGMTYEEGVRDALQWITGDSDDAPIEASE